jgi:AraC family transcriptional regulator, ethanolamine operon transcriptional activator
MDGLSSVGYEAEIPCPSRMSSSSPVLEPALFPVGLIVEQSADNADEMKELATFWSIEQEQLEPGPYSGRISCFHTQRLQISITHRSRGTRVRGNVPRQSVVFGLVLPSSGPTFYRCRRLAPQEIALTFPGDELMFQSMGASRVVSVAVSEELANAHALAIWGQSLASRCRDGRLLVSSGATAGEIGEKLAALIDDTLRRPERLQNEFFAGRLEQEILDALLEQVDAHRPRPFRSGRREFAIRAKEYLRAHANEPLRMGELCGEIGRSSRTLEIGFREAFGMSLKARLQAMRLNGAHRDLRAAKGSEKTVKEIAMKWGFMHLGRFSVNYRKWFCECPSETLGR